MAGLKVKIGADASEFERAMGKVRGQISSFQSMVGGLAAGAAAVYGITRAVQGIGGALANASTEAAGIESLTMQFETLLGSADAAKARMDEIAKFAASTPFEIKELAATSKLLQNLGGDVLATGEGLRLVGDAAAISGQPLMEVGLHVGRLFNAISSGTSAGESVNRLQELGLISGVAKKQFEGLAEAQKKGEQKALSSAQSLNVLQQVLGKTAGAMEKLATTTEGKLSNLSDNFSQLKVAFGTGMNDGLKAAIDVANAELPKLTEIFRLSGQSLGLAISEAVQGDTERLAKVGVLAGTVIGEGIKIGLKAAVVETGQGIWSGLETINPLRKMGMFRDTGKVSEYIQGGKSNVYESDLADAINQIVQAYKETTPSVMGYTPQSPEQRQQDSFRVFSASIDRQTRTLESIDRKLTQKPFPN